MISPCAIGAPKNLYQSVHEAWLACWKGFAQRNVALIPYKCTCQRKFIRVGEWKHVGEGWFTVSYSLTELPLRQACSGYHVTRRHGHILNA